MSRGKGEYGRSVVGGVQVYTSPSQLQLADSSSSQGCLRAWWYEKVDGREAAQSKSLDFGHALHEEVENYLITGIPSLSQLASAGRHMMPDPIPVGGPGLEIEKALIPKTIPASAGLAIAPLRAADIPVVGYIDVFNTRGTNKGCDNPADMYDPPGTIEILDWKTTSDAKWAKSGPELAETIQMTAYGKFGILTTPGVKHVRLSHGYFPKKGRAPFKSTILLDPEIIERRWEHAERVARSTRDAAGETDANKVDANTRACHRFNRDCPHRSYCTAGQHDSLADLFGQTAADELLLGANTLVRRPASSLDLTAPSNLDALLDYLEDNQAHGEQNAMTLVPTNNDAPGGLAGILGAPPAAPAAPSASDLAALAEQESEARDPELHALVKKIASYGLGMTALSGTAAAAFTRMRNIPITPGASIAGSGDLGKWTLSDRSQFAGLLTEIPKYFKIPSLYPEFDAPAPVVQAAPEPPPPAPAPVVQAPVQGAMVGILPPDAVEPTKPPPAAVVDPLAATFAQADDKETKEKAKAEKKAKAEAEKKAKAEAAAAEKAKAEAPVAVAAATTAPIAPTVTATAPVTMSSDKASSTVVYVDCIPSCAHESLWPQVLRLFSALGRKLGAPGDDPRLADPEGKGGYGRWKALFDAFLRDAGVAPGHWTLDGSFGEIGQIATEAYRRLAVEGTVVLVKGAR